MPGLAFKAPRDCAHVRAIAAAICEQAFASLGVSFAISRNEMGQAADALGAAEYDSTASLAAATHEPLSLVPRCCIALFLRHLRDKLVECRRLRYESVAVLAMTFHSSLERFKCLVARDLEPVLSPDVNCLVLHLLGRIGC